jgi:hypothetical protein
VHVSFGYGAKRESAKILGQCWKREATEDGVNHICISPEIADTAEVLATLLHELIPPPTTTTPATRASSPGPPPASGWKAG